MQAVCFIVFADFSPFLFPCLFSTDISNGIVPGMSELTRTDQATVAERAVRNVEVVVEDKIPHSAIVGID